MNLKPKENYRIEEEIKISVLQISSYRHFLKYPTFQDENFLLWKTAFFLHFSNDVVKHTRVLNVILKF